MTFYALAPPIATERQRQAALPEAGATSRSSEAVAELVRLSAQLFDAEMGAATIITARKMIAIAAHGGHFDDLDRNISFCSHVVARPEAVTSVLDAAEDFRFAGNPLVRGAPYVRFYAGAPLVAPCGSAVGALCAIDTQPRTSVSGDQQRQLMELAARATVELLGR